MGGAEAALLDLLASLREFEPEWKLELIVSADGAIATRARALGVSTTVLPFPDSLARLGDAAAGGPAGDITNRFTLLRQLAFANPGITGYVSRLRKLLRQRQPDLIHSNGFKMHLLGAMTRPRGVPLVWHVHDYVQSRPFMAALMKLFRKRCSLAIVNSNSVGRDVKAVCGDAFPIQTVYNGVNTKVFSPCGNRLDLDSLAGLSPSQPGTVRVGLLATLARWKGHETFLTALSLLAPELPVRGYIIGDALYQTEGSQTSLAELKGIAQRLGISSRVGFTGFVSEPASAMRALDIVVHASTQPEPFGLVIVEAMACGRAVIISEAGGALELIETGTNALGHTPGDAAQLAERITQLATDPELRAHLGAAGRATAEHRFNRSRLATELAPIYESLVQRSEVGSQKSRVRGQGSEVREAEANESKVQRPMANVMVSPRTLDFGPWTLDSASRSLRVLHVHAGNMYGGVEAMLLTQVRERSLAPDLQLSFALCFEGRLSEELAADGATVYLLGNVRTRQPLSIKRARRNLSELLQREAFDVVVTHSCWSQAIFGPTVRAEAVPLVFYMHGPAAGKHWLERWARRTVPDKVLCNSEFTAATLSRLYPGVRSEIVYCPVAPPPLQSSPAERLRTRAELQTPGDATVIIQVSRMEAWKGQVLHLEALSLLQDLPEWICWQVGGAQRPAEIQYLDELKRTAGRLGIAERVRFLEERRDVAQLLAAADIFCQPNTAGEPFGIVFIEALNAQLPVVTTGIGGAREIVDGSCGLLVPPGDVKALAAALRRLIENKTDRARLGSAGPSRARFLCDPAIQTNLFRDELSSVIYQQVGE